MYKRARVKESSSLGKYLHAMIGHFFFESTTLNNVDKRSWIEEHIFRDHQGREKLMCNVCDQTFETQ